MSSSVTNIKNTSSGIVPDKTSREKPAQNVSSKAASTQTVKNPAARSAPALKTHALFSPSSAAGLPKDALSAAVVSFARFFSLPLKPQTLAAIRRQVFSLPLPQSVSANAVMAEDASGSTAAKLRQSLSLAAAAAESKGVELQPKGLEAYAEAVDPDRQRRQDDEERQRRKKERGKEKKEEELKIEDSVSDIGSGGRAAASALKKTALESAELDPLLAILNKLPGKNGQRWIVLPFDFTGKGRMFRVSMRILLDEKKESAAYMALDIAECGEDGNTECRQLFVTEAARDKPVKLIAYLKPELSKKAQLKIKSELSALMEISPERVFVKTFTDPFPFETESADQITPIDRAV